MDTATYNEQPKVDCIVTSARNVADSDSTRTFSLRSGVEVLSTSDSALNGQARLVVAGNRYYHLDGLASRLLIALQAGPATITQLQDELLHCSDEKYGEQRIEETLNRLTALLILSDGREESTEASSSKKRSSYFALKVPLVSPRFLQPVTRLLAPMFIPAVVAWLFPLLAAGQVIFWLTERRAVPNLYHLPSGYVLITLLVANYAGLFFHELGHAAACARFGARHGAVGFSLYLVFPALYTDVTDSWRLSKTKRIIVDIGGTYMSLVAATIASVLFLKFGSLVFAQLCFIYGITVILNLNPFFRMDGYWVLADIMGLPNLMGANREVTWWLLRFGSRKWGSPPRVLYLLRRSQFIYFGYYLLFMVFTVFVTYYFYARYVPHTVRLLPGMVRELASNLRNQGMSLHVLGAGFGILVRSTPLLGPFIYAVRYLVRSFGQKSATVEQPESANSSVENTTIPVA